MDFGYNKLSSFEETVQGIFIIVDIVGDLPVILMEIDPDNNNSIEKTYIYANGEILAQHNGDHTAGRYFYLHDRLGSVRLIIDSSANVKNRYTYKPFGLVHSAETEEDVNNPFGFTGQWYDAEIGEYFLRARMYDPHINRFTGRDPVFGEFEQPLTLHKYLYCLNDPINGMDPWGLWTFHVAGTFMMSGVQSGFWTGGIVFDDKGNVELMRTVGIGVGSPNISGGITFGATSAQTVYDLSGAGYSVGGGISPGWLSVGGDFIYGGEYWGAEITFSPTIPILPPVEVHAHITGTEVGDFSFYEFYEWYENDVKERQIYEARTLGQAEAILFAWGAMDVINDILQY